MRILKKILIHTIVYSEYRGKDERGDIQWREPVTIEQVRVEQHGLFSRDKTQSTISANAVILVYAAHSRPFPRFLEQSKVGFEENEWIITRVDTIYQPYSHEVWAYELEVV